MKNVLPKIWLTCFLIGSVLFSSNSQAQCGIRYHNKIFQDSIVSNITYGYNTKINNQVDSLKMDIYLPKGDVVTSRPVVFIAHGGNFLGGSKTGADVVPLCKDLCSMGYVTVSINYRVGFTNFPFPGPDSTDAAETVMRAVHDGRAAVRYIRKTFENGNPYGVDTSKLFFGGVSAGGILAVHLAYLDQMSEFPPYIDTTNQPGLKGGIAGLSGNPGYSWRVHGIVNICGALGDSAWIVPNDVPLMSFHGNNDNTVPYGSDIIYLVGTYPLLRVDGSASLAIRATNLGITNCMETWEGQDHTPQVSNSVYYDSMLNITRNFLAHLVCGDNLNCSYGPAIVSVDEYSWSDPLNIYPNPAQNEFTIEFGEVNSSVIVGLYDLTGKLLSSKEVFADRTTLSRNNLAPGIYLLRVQSGDVIKTSKVIFE